MRVVFSSHAKTRCKQQNLNLFSIEKHAKAMPPFQGTIEWVTDEGDTIVARLKDFDGRTGIFIITVIGLQKKVNRGTKSAYHRGYKNAVARSRRQFQRRERDNRLRAVREW